MTLSAIQLTGIILISSMIKFVFYDIIPDSYLIVKDPNSLLFGFELLFEENFKSLDKWRAETHSNQSNKSPSWFKSRMGFSPYDQ